MRSAPAPNKATPKTLRQFITREFAETIAGKTPSPYLRTHDPAQRTLAEFSATPDGQASHWKSYFETTVHFWREVSLAGLPRGGRGADECYALLFESVFDLAISRPEWAAEIISNLQSPDRAWGALRQLAHHAVGHDFSHAGLIGCFSAIHAVLREQDASWDDDYFVIHFGEAWFWGAILCATHVDENHKLYWFRRGLSELSVDRWNDFRLHARLIREAPHRASTGSRAELQAHPLLRLARLKYRDGSVEQHVVLEFFNERCISAGFESEEDYFGNDLTLACWVRDARQWAGRLRRREPQRYAALITESGPQEVSRVQALFQKETGLQSDRVDALDATRALIGWGHRRRGHERSRSRGEIWEFIVETIDAALWLAWVFPHPPANNPPARCP